MAPRTTLPLALFIAAFATACVVEEEPPPSSPILFQGDEDDGTQGDGTSLQDDDLEGESCDPGDVRDCKVWLSSSGAYQNCFVGIQVCEDDGFWGACEEDPNATGESER